MARPRFVSISRINGWSVAIVCGLSLLLSGSLAGAAVSAAALVSPVMELIGSYAAERGDKNGLRWLPRSQLVLLAVILAYSVFNLVTFDAATELAEMSPDMRDMLVGMVGDESMLREVITLASRLVYSTLIVVSLLYQGGLFFYYRRAAREFQAASKA